MLAELTLVVDDDGQLPELEFRDAGELPYSLVLDTWPPSQPDDLDAAEIERAIGFRPASPAVLIAYMNDARSHRTLGNLALALADRTAGWIDFGGALVPYSSEPTSAADARNHVERLSLPGKVVSVDYVAADGRRWLSNPAIPRPCGPGCPIRTSTSSSR